MSGPAARAERRIRPFPAEPPAVALVMITDGRFHHFMDALNSVLGAVSPVFEQVIVVDDSADPEGAGRLDAYLAASVADATVIHHADRRGFTGAINSGWSQVDSARVDYVLHLEDDFVFKAPIDLREWVYPLTIEPRLAQVTLMRQPWSGEEIEAGGVFGLTPDAFAERSWGGISWVEHRRGYWSNPHVAPSWITDLRWPESEGEHGFSQLLFGAGADDPIPGDMRCAYFGRLTDPPRVEHIGWDRSQEWVD